MAYTNNNTVSKMQSSKAEELAHEQAYVTALYERLDVLRVATAQRLAAVRVGGTTETDQALSERDSLADEYQERGAELETAERNLCFGRLDFDDGDRLYIGRLTLRSAERNLLLADWRAKASQPFYRATPVERYGVTRRRHLRTAGRRVVGLDDDVLDLDAVDETHLTGEAALLASLRQARTGRMGDIVATIQADQDRIIRDGLNGILVVEGGPGHREDRRRAAPGRLPALHVPQAAGAARHPGHRPERHVHAVHRPGPAVARRERRRALDDRLAVPRCRRPRAGDAAGRTRQGPRQDGRRPHAGRRRPGAGAGQDHGDQGRRDDVPADPEHVPGGPRPGMEQA